MQHTALTNIHLHSFMSMGEAANICRHLQETLVISKTSHGRLCYYCQSSGENYVAVIDCLEVQCKVACT